ncbi:MAG: RagB/SusD family nutrient uptake outer membrane protein [Chitinophagaceae bacterium]|nr:MAG: RagB/SusD family nutrient uptake outer membrane protein [Chitinophagaceae bacterium]
MKNLNLHKYRLYLFVFALMFGSACKKALDVKPDQKLAVISNMADLQALLDYFPVMNHNDQSVAVICEDSYALTDAVFASRNDYEKRLYLYEGANVLPPSYNDWKDLYAQTYIANTVLHELKSLNVARTEQVRAKAVEGQALFHRAKVFFNVLSIWSLAYDEATADVDLGIPLRLDPDFNLPTSRASVRESYAQVIQDLKRAISLLPLKEVSATRAAKPAAFGYLARVYLSMRKYQEAALYADSALQLQSELLDYNKLVVTESFPVKHLNVEVLYDGRMPSASPITQARALIKPELFNMYGEFDLRKKAFFNSLANQTYTFKGHYAGRAAHFNGVATDELYLIRAEANVRGNDIGKGREALNYLLQHRYQTGKFVPVALTDREQLLRLIIDERRKELLMRGLRWIDIKRLNKEGANIGISRTVNGTVYLLPANDKRFALAIPEDVVAMTGISQNPR